MNVKRYIIDYTKLVNGRLPAKIRKPKMKAFMMTLVNPFIFIYNSLKSLRDQLIYKLTITPQVVYLQKMLNDRYDSSLRRIHIEDGLEYNALPIYMKAELKPVPIYRKSEALRPKKFLYTKGEAGQFTFDFVVYVPIDISFDSNEMVSLINSYKLASMFFKIQTF
jgi:hypothetical protein